MNWDVLVAILHMEGKDWVTDPLPLALPPREVNSFNVQDTQEIARGDLYFFRLVPNQSMLGISCMHCKHQNLHLIYPNYS